MASLLLEDPQNTYPAPWRTPVYQGKTDQKMFQQDCVGRRIKHSLRIFLNPDPTQFFSVTQKLPPWLAALPQTWYLLQHTHTSSSLIPPSCLTQPRKYLSPTIYQSQRQRHCRSLHIQIPEPRSPSTPPAQTPISLLPTFTSSRTWPFDIHDPLPYPKQWT